MIQLIICFLLAVIAIPVALFMGAFVFLLAATLIYTPFGMISDWFNRKK